jgi:hypothetical protein
VAVEALREDAQDAGLGPRLLNVIADQAGSAQISVDPRGCPQIEDQTKWIVLAHRIERIWPPSKVTGDRLGSVVSLSEHHPAPA